MAEKCPTVYEHDFGWSCSLRIGHLGQHMAYVDHDLDEDCEYVWPQFTATSPEVLEAVASITETIHRKMTH